MTKLHFKFLFCLSSQLVFLNFAFGQIDSIYNRLKNTPPSTVYPNYVSIGMNLVGKPYLKNCLSCSLPETLYFKLSGFDCVTFIESTLALADDFSTSKNFENFKLQLTSWRYRNAKVDYTNRLHYFSDWISYHENRGKLKNITKDLGGVEFNKKINFISSNKHKIKQMEEPDSQEKILGVEKKLNDTQLFFIPKNKIAEIESKVETGDIICLTTTKKGLDVDHVGFAVKLQNKIHFLHASHHLKRVVLTKEAFTTYINRHKHHTGIIILRLKK